ncbi:cytochrome P460 family protein [Microbulbifer sp. PSTR4-B]|uniref:cytochrome P460 family protein n=1 Tax=Microbulbifer sp. PSTR4-B TaxID=3243396 RepID=UPI0040394B68
MKNPGKIILGTLTAIVFYYAVATLASESYKSSPSTFATSYKHIDIEPMWIGDNKLELVQPKNFRRWVFIGSPITPNGLNGGNASFPEYHNVYVQPRAFEYYRKHGEWPEGTIMLKELQLTGGKATELDGSRYESSGRGYFPGPVYGMDVSVKDSTRFQESNGWGYFNFGHHAPPYAASTKVMDIANCAGCHMANASEDMVFMDLYRPLVTPLKLPDLR